MEVKQYAGIVEQAFEAIERINFVPPEMRDWAAVDEALPIGYQQTISQPTTVRLMLGWLRARPGDRVLDVGSGSGWTSALLAHIVGPNGYVYAVERIPQLVEFGRRNAKQTGMKNVQFYRSGATLGLPHHAPYDRILVSAASDRVPQELLDQLKSGGKLVIPINHDIFEITKTGAHEYRTETHSGFVFVPLL